MDIGKAFTSQYLAALAMLEETIARCPSGLWVYPQAKDQFWQIANHALFYTHLYVQESEATFTVWPKHRKDYHYLGPIGWDNNRLPEIGEPYTQAEILEYLGFCREEVKTRLSQTDFGSPSGFGWLPFDELEFQVYVIRHLQLHTGELAARLSGRGSRSPGSAWGRREVFTRPRYCDRRSAQAGEPASGRRTQ